MQKVLLTIPEAAEQLSLGKSKLYELISAGEIPVVRIGRAVRISARAVSEFAAKLEADAE